MSSKAVVKPAALPSKIIVGSVAWKIVWNADLENETLGLCESSKYEIHISKTVEALDAKRSILLHEILHAVYFTYGFRPTQKDHHEHEEEVVSFLASALFDTFARNQDIAAFVFTNDR
jgi:hypothetical protein